MTRITFYTANGAANPLAALATAKQMLVDEFGGATLTPGEGIWRSCELCAPESEPALTIVALTEGAHPRAQAERAAGYLRTIFAQKEVLYTVETLGHIGHSTALTRPVEWMPGVVIPPGL